MDMSYYEGRIAQARAHGTPLRDEEQRRLREAKAQARGAPAVDDAERKRQANNERLDRLIAETYRPQRRVISQQRIIRYGLPYQETKYSDNTTEDVLLEYGRVVGRVSRRDHTVIADQQYREER